jgi:hypothetical protein
VRRVRIAAVFLASVVFVALPAPAGAQSAVSTASRFEVGIGALWIGSQPLGDTAAAETIASGGSTTLFNASSELAGAGGIAAHAGVRIGRWFAVEASGSYLKPQLRIAVSGDAEGAAAVTATESIQQFMVGGDVVWSLPRRAGRVEPFVLAGGGYLRQLHQAATLVETGRYYDVGGGVSWPLMTNRHWRLKGAGARVDARAVVRSKGVAFDGGSKSSPAVAASAFVRF